MSERPHHVAIVTGGARGIGEAISRKLASTMAVGVADLDLDAASLVARSIRKDGVHGAVPVRMDVTSMESVQQGFATVTSELGFPDVVVANAGMDKVRPFLGSSPSDWAQIINVNLLGVIHCCSVGLPPMIETGWGRVVTISSSAGLVGSSGEAVYSATKGGVIAFTKSLARESARTGVTFNSVAPGPTDTPMLEGISAEYPKLVDALLRSIPMRRLAFPGEIASAVAFLVSEEAAYITGQTVAVNGGLTMHS